MTSPQPVKHTILSRRRGAAQGGVGRTRCTDPQVRRVARRKCLLQSNIHQIDSYGGAGHCLSPERLPVQRREVGDGTAFSAVAPSGRPGVLPAIGSCAQQKFGSEPWGSQEGSGFLKLQSRFLNRWLPRGDARRRVPSGGARRGGHRKRCPVPCSISLKRRMWHDDL
jgi:hypothetical protein